MNVAINASRVELYCLVVFCLRNTFADALRGTVGARSSESTREKHYKKLPNPTEDLERECHGNLLRFRLVNETIVQGPGSAYCVVCLVV